MGEEDTDYRESGGKFCNGGNNNLCLDYSGGYM